MACASTVYKPSGSANCLRLMWNHKEDVFFLFWLFSQVWLLYSLLLWLILFGSIVFLNIPQLFTKSTLNRRFPLQPVILLLMIGSLIDNAWMTLSMHWCFHFVVLPSCYLLQIVCLYVWLEMLPVVLIYLE